MTRNEMIKRIEEELPEYFSPGWMSMFGQSMDDFKHIDVNGINILYAKGILNLSLKEVRRVGDMPCCLETIKYSASENDSYCGYNCLVIDENNILHRFSFEKKDIVDGDIVKTILNKYKEC